MLSCGQNSLNFAGRQKELFQLKALHDQKQNVLLSGPAGIGKSALLNQMRIHSALLICQGTSTVSDARTTLERQLAVSDERPEETLVAPPSIASFARSGLAVAFDPVADTSLEMAQFIAELSKHVPVWIVCRSEQPYILGQIWNDLSDFVRMELSPLKRSDTRVLIAQAVSTGMIQAEALKHTALLYKISKGNPRRLQSCLNELSALSPHAKISFAKRLKGLDKTIGQEETKRNGAASCKRYCRFRPY